MVGCGAPCIFVILVGILIMELGYCQGLYFV
ncbi:TetR family transcriptional regulator, partial [Klebsiella michiganensis]